MEPEQKLIRLQKFLALNNVASRRKSEELIADGQVTVNGNVATLGMSVDPIDDIVCLNGARLSAKPAIEQKSPLVVMMNKPCGYICSMSDPLHKQTVYDLLPAMLKNKRMLYCGRLDKDTEGMLIFTDDGDFAQKLTHPSSNVQKRYEVVISRDLDQQLKMKMLSGVEDNGEFLKFEKIVMTGKGSMRGKMFEIILKQGHKNEIRRMFEHFGYFVKHLRRIQIGRLLMRGVSTGNTRKLTPKEISLLFA